MHVKSKHVWGVGEVWCVQGLHQGVEIVQGVAAPGLHVYTEPVLMPFEPAIRRLMRHATWPRGPAAPRRSLGSHPLSLKIASDWPCCLLDRDENNHLLSGKKKAFEVAVGIWNFLYVDNWGFYVCVLIFVVLTCKDQMSSQRLKDWNP